MGLPGRLTKHFTDMGSVKTRKQVETEEATKGQRTFREGERTGVVVGGAGGAAVATAAIKEKEKQKEKRMTEKEKSEIKEELRKRADKFLKPSKAGQTLIDKLKNKKEDKEEMMKGGMVKKYAKGGVATKKMMGGGMAMKYAKGGMANCGASVKPSGGSRNK